jgi:hypothetical protein
VKRQLDRQQELRENALFYAAAGEQTAAFLVSFIDRALLLMGEVANSKRKPPKALADAGVELLGLVLDAEAVLEPWRGRVCLDLIDDFIAGAGDSEDDAVDGLLEQALGEDEPVDSES